jgi:TRAP-type mannitol/chloroaromatic compound transport system substrate-binding protein
MKRSLGFFLAGIAAGVLVALVTLGGLFGGKVAPPAASAQAPIRWKVQTGWPPTSIVQDAAKLLVEMLEKNTGGRLKIDLLPGGAIVPVFEIQDAVNRGVLDAGHTTPGYIIGKLQAFIPLTHGPLLGMDFIDYFGWYWEGGGHELLNEAYQKQLKMNVVTFQVHPEGPQAMGWFKKEIRTFNDIKGMKYRIYGIGAETYGRLGVSVVTIPGQEIVPAMERGVIEGAEWINCLEDKKLGLHKTAKYYYTPGMHEPVTGGQLMFNKDVWAKLPADLQEMVKVASVYATTMRNQMFNRETADACQELLKEGVQMKRMPDDVLINFLNEWEKIQAEYAEKSPFYKKVIESQKAYAGKVVPFRLSWFPPYDLAGNYYWKDKVYLGK